MVAVTLSFIVYDSSIANTFLTRNTLGCHVCRENTRHLVKAPTCIRAMVHMSGNVAAQISNDSTDVSSYHQEEPAQNKENQTSYSNNCCIENLLATTIHITYTQERTNGPSLKGMR